MSLATDVVLQGVEDTYQNRPDRGDDCSHLIRYWTPLRFRADLHLAPVL